jgi:TM2 domain-containing membrane protein YozV
MALTEAQKKKIEEEERQAAHLQSAMADALKSSQKHGIPALLSFFIPGLGQMVKGKVGKGIGIFFGWLLSFALIFTVIGIVVPIIIWIWQIIDVYNN